MKRRQLLKNMNVGIVVATTATVLPSFAGAHDEDGIFTFSSTMTIEHGHVVELTLPKLIAMAREIQSTDVDELPMDIQGGSGHNHVLSFSLDDITKLLFEGELEKDSTTESSHKHTVTMLLQ